MAGNPTGILFNDPQAKPLSTTGSPQAGAYWIFYLTGTTTPANVYQDGGLTTPLSQVPGTAQPSCTADSAGRFNPIYLDPSVTYRVQLFNQTGSKLEDTDPYVVPTGITTATEIGELLYPQSVAEINAGVSPVNYEYPPNHIFRYITDLANVLAGTSGVDNSVGAQNWLNTLTVGCTATLIGTVNAQGLILKTSDVRFTGGGWLKPVSNAVTATVLQIGQDSTSTYVRRIAGSLNIGDKTAFYTNWSNITGLALQYGAEHNLTLNLYGLGVGMTFNPTLGASAYCQFVLQDVINNGVGILFNATGTGGYCNEHDFFGGRFSMNSSSWAAGQCYIYGHKVGTNLPNNIRFWGPSFEGANRVLDWGGESLRIENARWETGLSSGTAGTDFDTVFWNFTSDATRNRINLSYNSQWLSGVYTNSLGSGTQINNSTFTMVGDMTPFITAGCWLAVTISGVVQIVPVFGATYSSPNTTVYCASDLITASPTAVVGARINDAGTLNSIKLTVNDVPTIASCGSEAINDMLMFLNHCALYITSLNVNYPAMTLSSPASAANDALRIVNAGSGGRTAGITGAGDGTFNKLGLYGNSPAGQVTGWGTPTGITQVSNFPGASATLAQCSGVLAKIIADLKTLGYYAA